MVDFSVFEEKIGVVFKNKDLLKQAFTHRSYINEHQGLPLGHNERLEFLGDAVLELAVTEYLFKKYPDKPEGDLTSYRSALVNTSTLSTVATGLGMNDFLLLSRGETKDTGRARQYLLANTFEALTGALYIDQGYTAAQRFIAHTIFPLTDDIVSQKLFQDAKSLFQEKAQEIVSITPGYRSLKEEGPDHDKEFTVGLFLDEELIATGEGKSKQEAEQAAARAGLEKKGWQ